MAEPRASMFVSNVGWSESGNPPVDGDSDEWIVSIATIDLRDAAGGPVDDAKAILANQKPDLLFVGGLFGHSRPVLGAQTDGVSSLRRTHRRRA